MLCIKIRPTKTTQRHHDIKDETSNAEISRQIGHPSSVFLSISAETLNLVEPDDAAMNKSKLEVFNEATYGEFYQRPYPAQTYIYGPELQSILPTISVDLNTSMLQENLYLVSIQKYINKLGFCREGEPKIKIDGTKCLRYQMETAKQIIKVGESIKCPQALVLGIYFTNCLARNHRFPISFRYSHKGKEYIHVVLGSKFESMVGRYGALVGQILLEVKIGELIPHDRQSLKHIGWEWRTLGSKSLEDPKEVARLDSDLEWRIIVADCRRREVEFLIKYPNFRTRDRGWKTSSFSSSYSTTED